MTKEGSQEDRHVPWTGHEARLEKLGSKPRLRVNVRSSRRDTTEGTLKTEPKLDSAIEGCSTPMGPVLQVAS